MAAHFRILLENDFEMSAGVGMISYHVIPVGLTYDEVLSFATRLGFQESAIDRAESPFVSVNFEPDEDWTVIGQGLSRKEVMELEDSKGTSIEKFYNEMAQEDKEAFDAGFNEDQDKAVDVQTEELKSWEGPSLHF